MKATTSRIWNAPASELSRLAGILLDLAFTWRIVRIQWLRKFGRHREADRVLHAVRREFERQRRG